MNHAAKTIQRTYLQLTLLSTLAGSFIWGINTLFLLDAGLNNTQAFAANAAFMFGQVLFEVPTGVVADTWGRRTSFLLGAMTLSLGTVWYVLLWQGHAAFVWWVLSSMILGLGFTFFSGATEAWLVDALDDAKFKGNLEHVFSRGQMAVGVAMLAGSVIGGVLADRLGLGWPYYVRALFFGLTAFVAFVAMFDKGFTPRKPERMFKEMKLIVKKSVHHGFGNRPVRWVILGMPFTAGIGFYVFYAAQPHLLQLYGDNQAYSIAGIVAAIVAGSQILGGIFADKLTKIFKKRTDIMIATTIFSTIALVLVWKTGSFWWAVVWFVVWAVASAMGRPAIQAYLNKQIPSSERATVLSFASMVGSVGGTAAQPALGRVADVYSYGTSFLVSGIVQIISLPFYVSAKRTHVKADEIKGEKISNGAS